MQERQPEIVIGAALCAKIKLQGFAQALQGVGAWIDFAAFDALDGAGADFTCFRQLFLRQAFLLAQFGDFDVRDQVGSCFTPFEYSHHYKN